MHNNCKKKKKNHPIPLTTKSVLSLHSYNTAVVWLWVLVGLTAPMLNNVIWKAGLLLFHASLGTLAQVIHDTMTQPYSKSWSQCPAKRHTCAVPHLNVFEMKWLFAVLAVEGSLRTFTFIVPLLFVEADALFTWGTGDDHELTLSLMG